MDPYGYAGDFLSGIRRFLPRWRNHTHSAGQYLRNWRRSLSFRQALPLPADVILGIAGVALADDRPRIAVAYLVGYVGLLRITELLKLTPFQLHFVRNSSSVIVSFPDSKGAKRQNSPKRSFPTPASCRPLHMSRGPLNRLTPSLGCQPRTLRASSKSTATFWGFMTSVYPLQSKARRGQLAFHHLPEPRRHAHARALAVGTYSKAVHRRCSC